MSNVSNFKFWYVRNLKTQQKVFTLTSDWSCFHKVNGIEKETTQYKWKEQYENSRILDKE